MTIGQKDFVTKKTVDRTTTTAEVLQWGDPNVIMFTAASGAKSVYLPEGNVANSYGEIWICNSQTAGNITVEKEHAATDGHQNLVTNTDVTIAPGSTGHFFYVPYLRNAAKPLHDEKIDGAARGMWVGGVLKES